MKCIKCGQEIPDNSTICPYCNSELTQNNQVLPNTPDSFVLPKDQQQAENGSVTQNQEVVVPPQPVVQKVVVKTVNTLEPANESAVIEPNLPVENPTQPEMIQPEQATPAPVVPQEQPQPLEPAQPVQQAPVTPTPSVTPTTFDPAQMNLENVDLISNRNLPDGYTGTASEKIASTIDHKKENIKAKKKKLLSVVIIFMIIFAFIGAGYYFYYTQFQTSEKRINATVDTIFSSLNSIKNDSVEEGSGTYKLDFSLAKNNDTLSIKSNGNYAYNLPTKKIDLIANFNSINHNGELLSGELNTELFLENSRAYFLLQNFSNQYVYTDVNNSKNVLDDIQTRFNSPEELLLFRLANNAYDNGVNDFTNNYEDIMNNISQNDINYTGILSAFKSSLKTALNSGSVSQNFENNNNIVRINLSSAYTNKEMVTTFINTLSENKSFEDLAKLYGKNAKDLKEHYLDISDRYQYTGIDGNITIVTNAFNNSFVSLSFPIKKGDKVYLTKIIPYGSGYQITQYLDGNEVTNITYSKKTTTSSTTTTKTYDIKGSVYIDGVANNINIVLELVKDVNPNKINVVTRNSIDYKFLTTNDYNELAEKIRNFGNLGVVFNSHYVGVTSDDQNPDNTDQTTTDTIPTE